MNKYDDISEIHLMQETIFTSEDSYHCIPHAVWAAEDKPFALIADQFANSEINVSQFKPGYVFQIAGLTLEVVGREPPMGAWFVKRHEGTTNDEQ